jgi:hypothetical protein
MTCKRDGDERPIALSDLRTLVKRTLEFLAADSHAALQYQYAAQRLHFMRGLPVFPTRWQWSQRTLFSLGRRAVAHARFERTTSPTLTVLVTTAASRRIAEPESMRQSVMTRRLQLRREGRKRHLSAVQVV